MRRSYVVPMRWMVIYEYEVPGGSLNLSSTKLPRPWSPCESSQSRKNPHGRTGNRNRDLKISSQELWPLDHEAGLNGVCTRYKIQTHKPSSNHSFLAFSKPSRHNGRKVQGVKNCFAFICTLEKVLSPTNLSAICPLIHKETRLCLR
jgi:hypothetical protein